MSSEMFDANAFSGYRVLITGSSRGIGHEVAMALRRLGAGVGGVHCELRLRGRRCDSSRI